MNDVNPFYTLESERSSIVIDCRTRSPAILYWGPKPGDATTPEMLATLNTRQEAHARVETEAPISLSPEAGTGFPGSPGIEAHRNGRHWGTCSRVESVANTDDSLTIRSLCESTDVEIVHRLRMDHDSNVLSASTEITNVGKTPLDLGKCDALTIPLPLRLNRILSFEGRWSDEFRQRSVERFPGTYLRENRSGRTSHDTFPGVVLHTARTDESQGEAVALHLGWSGNHRLRVEELSDGRAFAQFGELFLPGEIALAPGENYRSPTLFGVSDNRGFTGISRCFHRYVRKHLVATRMFGKTKPVHFNTWEAMYFDLSLERLCGLADRAAAIGVERFVLDDGWFRNRKSDNAGLGDWYVDETVFPDGLSPLIDYVNARGMEFGLWIEPEMVNPDSDLYRAHPGWVLHLDPAPRQLARNQLVLDLTRTEVQAYLFERIDALLSEYPIAYLKWDMNRDLTQPGGQHGRAVTHYQTVALYELLRRIRDAHPEVEIESCSSGGGRADFGILGLTDRVWTSDNNDPVDRVRIQKGFSFFFPAEFMGAHVGPRRCHISGREASMTMRAGVALFGDMGIEADLLEMSAEETDELKAAVELHKQHRDLLFSGELFRMDTDVIENAFGVVAIDKKRALFSYVLLDTTPHSAPGRYFFRGLELDQLYSISVVWPIEPMSYSKSILDEIDGVVLSGAALMRVGMQLPIVAPQSVLVFYLQAID